MEKDIAYVLFGLALVLLWKLVRVASSGCEQSKVGPKDGNYNKRSSLTAPDIYRCSGESTDPVQLPPHRVVQINCTTDPSFDTLPQIERPAFPAKLDTTPEGVTCVDWPVGVDAKLRPGLVLIAAHTPESEEDT